MKTPAERMRKDALKKRDEADEMQVEIESGKLEEGKIPDAIKAIGSLMDEADKLEADAKALDALAERSAKAKAERELNAVDDEPKGTANPAKQVGTKSAAETLGGVEGDLAGLIRALAAKAWNETPAATGGLKCFKGINARSEAYAFGMWGLAALVGQFVPDAVKFCAEKNIAIKAVSMKSSGIEGQNVLGGALVPQEFSTRLIDLKETYGVVRANSYIEPMGSDSKLVPRRKGGLTAYGRAEAVNATSSTAQWEQVELVAKIATVFTQYSIELNEDSIIAFGDRLMYEVAYAFTYLEDNCAFNGDGTSTYLGIKGLRTALTDVSSNKSVVTAGSTGSWSAIVFDDLLNVVGALPEYADRGGAKWYNSRNFYYQVMLKAALAAGGVTAAEIISGVTTRSFMGYPVVFAQVMPRTTEASKIETIFGDLSLGSTFGNRKADAIAMSEHAAFQSGQLAIRGDERFAFVAHDVGTATDAGPIVGLKT